MISGLDLYSDNYKWFNSVGNNLNKLLFEKRKPIHDTAVVLVTHAKFTSIPEIEASLKICGKEENIHLIFKDSTNNNLDFIEYSKARGWNHIPLSKSDFKFRPDRVIDTMKNIKNKNIAILDHGGYFGYHFEDYKDLPIKTVIEYTKNGHNLRYNNCNFENIIYSSLCNSCIKNFPDKSNGRQIGELATSILKNFRGFGFTLKGIFKVGIIGFGDVGSNVANTLRSNGAQDIMVFDTNNKKMIEAALLGYNINCDGVEDIISKCNIVVIGADTAPIKPEMYKKAQDGLIIITATSADDSLGLDELINGGHFKNGQVNNIENRVTSYQHNGKKVHLISAGNAANLVETNFPLDDSSIAMPLSLHALLGHEIMETGKQISDKRMSELENDVMNCYLKSYLSFLKKINKQGPEWKL